MFLRIVGQYGPWFILTMLWKWHNFWLAKPYGLANKKLSYFRILYVKLEVWQKVL